MPDHAASWLYFPDTDDLYMGFTHFSILNNADLSPVMAEPRDYDDEGEYKFDNWPPYVAGQIDHDGDAQVETD